LIAAFWLSTLCCPAFALQPVPDLTGRVVDQTGTLSASDIASLEQTLAAFEKEKGSQVAVLMVSTTEPEAIEQYSIRVVDAWKLGRKKIDDGALLLIAKDDRAMRIEVGYGLEGALNDAVCKRIISEIITPYFKSGDFAAGIAKGVHAMLGVISGEPLPPPPEKRPGGEERPQPLLLLFPAFFLAIFLRSIFGRMLGGTLAGGAVGVLTALVLGSVGLGIVFGILALILTAASNGGMGGMGRGPRGFGGGFGGGGFGRGLGGGGGFGGFGGGGGGFGGGGASGRW